MLSEGLWWRIPKGIGASSIEEPAKKVCEDLHIFGFKMETEDAHIESEKERWSEQLL